MKKIYAFVALFLLFSACSNSPKPITEGNLYFDLTGYFNSEAKRLAQLNPTITKLVAIDTNLEQKAIKIKDWYKEFNAFNIADINKASWKGQFKTQQNDSLVIYTNVDDKIVVKSLAIKKRNGKIRWISAIVKTNNLLYQSTDSLSYFPDSLYRIIKTQKIRFMPTKKYQIIGTF